MRHITVIAELGSTIAYFTVHESSIGHFRPGRGETGCTILGLTKRYGLGERELNIVRALKFNESATFEVPDIVTPVQVTPPKAEPRTHMPAARRHEPAVGIPGPPVGRRQGARAAAARRAPPDHRGLPRHRHRPLHRHRGERPREAPHLALRVRRYCPADVQLRIDELCGS
jgi:hypothetical protein